jgi:hypothetical protein
MSDVPSGVPSLCHSSRPECRRRRKVDAGPRRHEVLRVGARRARADVGDLDGAGFGAVALPQLEAAWPSSAEKYSVPSAATMDSVSAATDPGKRPGAMSFTIHVPPVVPSLRHNSSPCCSSAAAK